MRETEVIDLIFKELKAAEKKHPAWPEDVIHAVSIMNEEAGEAIQAAIDLHYEKGKRRRYLTSELKRELAQTAAMCIRNLINL